MKRSSIFRKTFWYSFFIMLLVILIAHIVIWITVPNISVVEDATISGMDNIINSEINMSALLKEPLLKGLCVSFTCCIIIVFILSYLWTWTIVKPIKYIAHITKKMANLEPGVECKINTNDEFENLSDNINELYKNLFFTIEQLKEQIKKVNECDQSKIDFLRAASHELKTPLTACNAMIENMILKIGKYKNYDIYLPECKVMIEKMGLMIQDMLDMSRLRNGVKALPKEKIKIRQLIEEISMPFELIAKAKQIHFIVEIKNDNTILVDATLFKRALSNVIINAILYTNIGKDVVIACDNDKIVIANEGKIIEGENLKNIFDPFFRMGDSHEGNGLGLYIVDTIFTSLGIKYTFNKSKQKNMMEFTIYLENHAV